MADFGSDFSAVNDLDANLSVVTGRTCLAQALVRRCDTPRGGLWYAPSYGKDALAYVNTSTDPRIIEQDLESELLADERVDDAEVTLTIKEPDDRSVTGGKTYELQFALDTGDGPFDFTLDVENVSGNLLIGGLT